MEVLLQTFEVLHIRETDNGRGAWRFYLNVYRVTLIVGFNTLQNKANLLSGEKQVD